MLTSNQDAFGHLLLDYLKGKKVLDIGEREDGVIAWGNTSDYFAEYRNWKRPERQALRYVRDRVLDIGCGAGRISLYLQSKGFNVLATDVSPLAIRVCKLRGVKRAKVLSITRLSSRLGRFGTVIMVGDNFGLFGNPKRAKWLLRRFRNMTEADGRIIVESLDPHKIVNATAREYHAFNKAKGKLPGQWRIRIRHMTYATPWFEYLLVSKREMQSILKGTGWRITRTFDNGLAFFAVIEREM